MKPWFVSTTLKLAVAVSAASFARAVAADPVSLGNVGPVHGEWTMNGKVVHGAESVPPGAVFALAGRHVPRGTPRSIAIYLVDGELITKSCSDDASCAGHFSVDEKARNDVANADVTKSTNAMAHYRFTYATPASRAAFDSTPTDGVVRLDPSGDLAVGQLFSGIAPGSYRVEFRQLDPNKNFVAGDPVSHSFEWTGDTGVIFHSPLPDGLYSLQLFSKTGIGRELGSSAWVAVLGSDRADAATRDFARARDITAKWKNAEATEAFLRAYLTSIATAP